MRGGVEMPRAKSTIMTLDWEEVTDAASVLIDDRERGVFLRGLLAGMRGTAGREDACTVFISGFAIGCVSAVKKTAERARLSRAGKIGHARMLESTAWSLHSSPGAPFAEPQVPSFAEPLDASGVGIEKMVSAPQLPSSAASTAVAIAPAAALGGTAPAVRRDPCQGEAEWSPCPTEGKGPAWQGQVIQDPEEAYFGAPMPPWEMYEGRV